MRVLITEDDLATRKMLRFVVEQQAGHEVIEAETAAEALQALEREQPGLLLVDLILPDLDGLELVARARRVSSVPIIIVSARATIQDRVRGLKSGADDYLVKPFDPAELLARVDALLRRVRRTPRLEAEQRIRVGPLLLDPPAQAVELDGRGRVRLTPTELRLLLHLARAPGEVRSRHSLEQAMAQTAPGEPVALTPAALNTYISSLRQKIEPNPERPRLIETVRARGYRLAV